MYRDRWFRFILKTQIYLKEKNFMAVTKKPDLSDPILRAKLAKGMGHNYYGEPAWPNDLLYMFPVTILGTFACVIGLAVLDPAVIGEPANPFATPLEILPEWYFYSVFQVRSVIYYFFLGWRTSYYYYRLLVNPVPLGVLGNQVYQLQNGEKAPTPHWRGL
eukprot:TRINITY_DN2997_c0_g2_i9.p2 TRINITY_DN2997_c0_g2~~TRINITY_DN2997_c0_g2_i9.p2  ORF type:complete len:161 (-),score=6.66 TRINITY_DN2997_c0_g2_i9:580-1062(-)